MTTVFYLLLTTNVEGPELGRKIQAVDGENKRGRPKGRWTDDLVDWCNKDICNLHGLAMDRRKWSHFMKYVMDTKGH